MPASGRWCAGRWSGAGFRGLAAFSRVLAFDIAWVANLAAGFCLELVFLLALLGQLFLALFVSVIGCCHWAFRFCAAGC